MTKLFVGSIAYSTTEDAIRELFAQCGTVSSCNLITDKFSGQSKGFAFVEMSTDEEAKEAIAKYNNFELDGRKMVVNVARPKEDRPRRDNFGGGGGSDRNFTRGPRR